MFDVNSFRLFEDKVTDFDAGHGRCKGNWNLRSFSTLMFKATTKIYHSANLYCRITWIKHLTSFGIKTPKTIQKQAKVFGTIYYGCIRMELDWLQSPVTKDFF